MKKLLLIFILTFLNLPSFAYDVAFPLDKELTLEQDGVFFVGKANKKENVWINDKKVAEAVVAKAVDYGIVCCGTGIGISLAANKVPGIRCAVVSDVFSAKMSKAHNDANMLSLGERVLGRGLALEIVDAWINTEFEGDRHSKRVNMIKEIEERYNK